MSQIDPAETLFCAVDEIVTKRIESINFDKTIDCVIIEDEEAKKGKYRVTDGSANFYAYSVSTDYKKDDAVYVTVPNGDFNNQKIIIGKKTSNETSPFIFTTPFDTIVDVTTNLITIPLDSSNLWLIANYPDRREVKIWEKNFNDTNQELIGFTRLGVQGQFRTWLNSFKCTSGNYGLKLILNCEEDNATSLLNAYNIAIEKVNSKSILDEEDFSYIKNSTGINWSDEDWENFQNLSTSDEKVKYLENERNNHVYSRYELFLSSEDMYGNPYNFDTFFQQEKVFDITNIYKIYSMELYFYQEVGSFFNQKGELVPYADPVFIDNLFPPNLFTKDSYICLGYDIGNFNKDQATLYCTNPSTYSSKSNIKSNNKNVILRWVHEFEDGFESVDEDSELDFEIRWYRYKLGAPSADEYSGVYWERVNDKITIEEPLEEIKAITSYYTFYTENRQNTYVQNFPYGLDYNYDSDTCYVGKWPLEILEKYHIPKELGDKSFFMKNGFQSSASLKIDISKEQNWLELYQNAFVFHDKVLQNDYRFPKKAINRDGVEQEIKGCLHYYGFLEKLSLAYRIYWLEQEAFDRLGKFDLLKTGGTNGSDLWNNIISGKNIYQDIKYKKAGGADYNIVLATEEGNYYNKQGSLNTEAWKLLLDSFTQSFGSWKMIEDEYGMKNYIPEDEEIYKELDNMLYNFFSTLNNPIYHKEITKIFYYNFEPDLTLAQEQVKVIILHNGKTIKSNVLTFTNEDEVVNEATADFLTGLNIWCKDNTYGNYFIYDPGNKILEEYDVKQAREFSALFSVKSNLTASEQENSLLTEATSITWTFPVTNTMITAYGIDYSVPYPDKNNSEFIVCAPQGMSATDGEKTYLDGQLHTIKYILADKSEVLYDHIAKLIMITRFGDINNAEAIDANQLYFIKRDYIQSFANNIVQCSIIKNNKEFFTSKELFFGQAGTTGTDVTLKIYIDPHDKFALTKDDDGDVMRCRALLFDSHNKEVDPNDSTKYENVKYEWSWFVYKYDDNKAENRFISVEIEPAVGGKNSTLTEKDQFTQIIKNKEWILNSDTSKYELVDNTKYYYNSLRNEVVLSANNSLDMNHLLILQCTVTGWGDYDLTTYKPIAIKLRETYSYADTANEIIYLTSGYPEYYSGKWKIHLQNVDNDNDGYEDEDKTGYWKIFNPFEENVNYIGSMKNNSLIPTGIYMEGVKQYGAQYVINTEYIEAIKILDSIPRTFSAIDDETKEKIKTITGLTIEWEKYEKNKKKREEDGEEIMTYNIDAIISYINSQDSEQQVVWTQPVICLKNNYPSGTLNKWSGKEIEINDENGYILSPAIAAGKKNSDNTFSGVMLGDWSVDPLGVNSFISKQTGVYGFHHGMVSYAFMEDGTAFIGKAGRGRIYINGDKSTIQSEGYNLGHGVLIDLDDNLIEMKNGSGGIYLDAKNDLKIDFSTKAGDSLFLLDTSTGKYYLKSEDYVKDEAGILIDLAENRIYAYNFILEASGEGGTLTLDSSDETYPFNVNDKFKIAWDGGIVSTWGKIGGFYISDHAIFGSPFTKPLKETADWANGIGMFNVKTYWGKSSANASTYDFRLGNTLIYRGDQNGTNSRGRLYLASNLYSFRGGDSDITSSGDLKADSYFIYGINKDDNLQVGSASSRSEYKDVNIYGGASSGESDGEEGSGAAIRLIPQGSEAADFSLKITKDKLIVKNIEPESQKGIYARFG